MKLIKDLMARRKNKVTESGTSPKDPSVTEDPKEPTTQQASADSDRGQEPAVSSSNAGQSGSRATDDDLKSKRDAVANADGNTNAAGGELTGDETPDAKIQGGVNVGADPTEYRKGETTETVVHEDGTQEVVVKPAENPQPYEGRDSVETGDDPQPVEVESELVGEKADYKAGYTSKTVVKRRKDGTYYHEVVRVKVENYENPSKGKTQAEALTEFDEDGAVEATKDVTESNCTHPAWTTHEEVSRKENKDGTVTTKFRKKCNVCGKEVVSDDAGNYNP